jgi:superfamily II DNA or RNA helicase
VLEGFEPREYQKKIMEKTIESYSQQRNVLIELDCGAGKRFLQYYLIYEIFKNLEVLLVLQATTSLMETYRYFIDTYKAKDVNIIHSQLSSENREYILRTSRVVLTLPQTLNNTLLKYPDAIDRFKIVMINEVDQIILRQSNSSYLKQPYPKLTQYFTSKLIIGMSGTLRDDHYVLTSEQREIKNELHTLLNYFQNTDLISMDSIIDTDLKDYTETTEIVMTGVQDDAMMTLSIELDTQIDENLNKIIEAVLEIDPVFGKILLKNPKQVFTSPLPIEDEISNEYFRGFFVRKYLWGLPGEQYIKHLYSYGLDPIWVRNTYREVPLKFHAVKEYIQIHNKSVVLCSYISTCKLLAQLLDGIGINNVVITGESALKYRDGLLQQFRESQEQIVAIISNVGERDLDIPDASLLIVFDLVRTTKTVYQKLKRTRGGLCRVLFYEGTKEKEKATEVISKMIEKYPWSTSILPMESFSN